MKKYKIRYTNNQYAAYSNSLLQVSSDETEEKGYLLWTFNEKLNTYISEFKPVENPYSTRTIRIEDFATAKFKDTQKIKLVIPFDSTPADIIDIKNSIPNDVIFHREKKKNIIINDLEKKQINKDTILDESEYFNKYFKELGLSDDIITQLQDLDAKFNSLINKKTYTSNEYSIKELEIKNFLCFKGTNNIDFEKINGLVGLFGENGIGKSSLLIAIMFCLFNKTLKDSNKFIKLVNDQLEEPEEVYVLLRLIIEGVLWEIKRSLVVNNKLTSASVKLEVYEYVNGKKTERHKEDRIITDRDVLSPLVGNENIFTITVLSSQNQPTEFTDKKNAERLELTNQFLGLDTNTLKHELCNPEFLKLKTINETLEKNLHSLVQPDEIDQKTKVSQEIIDTQDIVIEDIKKNIEVSESKKNAFQKKLNNIPLISLEKNYEEMIEDQKNIENKITTINLDINTIDVEKESLTKLIEEKEKEIIQVKKEKESELLNWKNFSKIKDYNDWVSNTTDNTEAIASINREILGIDKNILESKNELNSVEEQIKEINVDLTLKQKEREKLISTWEEKDSYDTWKFETKNYDDLIDSYKEQITSKEELFDKETCPTCGQKWVEIDKEEVTREIEDLNKKILNKRKEEKEYNAKNKLTNDLKVKIEKLDKSVSLLSTQKLSLETSFTKLSVVTNQESEKKLKIQKLKEKTSSLSEEQKKAEVNNTKGLNLIKLIKSKVTLIAELETNVTNFKLSIEKKDNQKERKNNEIESLSLQSSKLDLDKENYLKNKEKIKERKEIEDSISLIEKEVNNLREEIVPLKSLTDKEKLNIENYLVEKEKYNTKLSELRTHSDKVNLYSYYINGMGKKGISLLILRDFIPFINEELNNALDGLFDFNIEFEVSDKNTLEISFWYENLPRKSKRDVNQACGKESTLINLIIRAALTKVSKLPKPSLLLLDEKFSMLDKKNLIKLPSLLEKLKSQYNVVIMITHDDDIKEWPDNYIILKNSNGSTTIC